MKATEKNNAESDGSRVMDKNVPLQFPARILKNGSEKKAAVSVAQPRTVLEAQNADKELLEPVRKVSNSLPTEDNI